MPTNVPPLRLPLSREEFRTALQKGQGRALMHVRRHGSAGLEQLILEACLRNQAYDPQCELDRADWMVEIMDAAAIQDAMEPQILSGLRASGSDDYWDQIQLCRLALIFARRGNMEFRSGLYAALRKREGSADFVACREIIELDGADGLLFVAERAGQWLARDPETYVGRFPLDIYDQKHGDGAAEKILHAAAAHNTLIATYMDHLDKEDEADLNHPELEPGQGTIRPDMLSRLGSMKTTRFDRVRSWSADDIIRDIETTDPPENRNRYLYRRWGKQAPARELQRIVESMFAEKDEKRVFFYLDVFVSRGLPEMDARLRDLAGSKDRETRWMAYRVMANHEHPIVRSLAIDRIRGGQIVEGELRLFRKNYRPGDWSLIEKALRLPDDREELHGVLYDLRDVFEVSKVEESCDPMMLIYEHSPCSLCRNNAVKALTSLGQAPDWLLEECRFDVDEDTRSIVGTR